MNLIFAKYDEALHLQQVVRLEQELWKGIDEKLLVAVFRWKYPANAKIRNAFVALDGELVVGFRGFFINEYRLGREVFSVAVLGDAVVSPHYQRKGIFANLTKFALDYYANTDLRYILALSSNSKSSPANIKMGWKPFTTKQFRIGFCWHSWVGLSHKDDVLKRGSYHGADIELYRELTPDLISVLSEFDRQTFQDDYMELLRNERYWKWRYAHPMWNAKYLIMRRRGVVCGFATFNETDGGFLSKTRVLDIKTSDDRDKRRLLKAVKYFCTTRCVVIQTSTPQNASNCYVKRAFPLLRKSKRNNPTDYFLVRKNHGEELESKDKKWYLNYVDID